MPAKSSNPTRLTASSNSVVLVGASGELAEIVRRATTSASGGFVILAQLATVATICAENRPYAMVIPEEVYWFCGPDLDALARDIDAGLIVVKPNIHLAVLSAALLDEARRLG